ncbi:hypothetical protein BHM03_00014917 [Ensete ventricosum]|nr:hypothetical protein BHM03_00014917 [Ensete ventricosum]
MRRYHSFLLFSVLCYGLTFSSRETEGEDGRGMDMIGIFYREGSTSARFRSHAAAIDWRVFDSKQLIYIPQHTFRPPRSPLRGNSISRRSHVQSRPPFAGQKAKRERLANFSDDDNKAHCGPVTAAVLTPHLPLFQIPLHWRE